MLPIGQADPAGQRRDMGYFEPFPKRRCNAQSAAANLSALAWRVPPAP